MSTPIITSTDEQFQQLVIDAERPVLVKFSAQWCGPCQALAPIFADTAQDYVGQVDFVAMDIDDNPNTPAQYGVRTIPTLLLFHQGQLAATKVGSGSQKDLKDFINNHLDLK